MTGMKWTWITTGRNNRPIKFCLPIQTSVRCLFFEMKALPWTIRWNWDMNSIYLYAIRYSLFVILFTVISINFQICLWSFLYAPTSNSIPPHFNLFFCYSIHFAIFEFHKVGILCSFILCNLMAFIYFRAEQNARTQH